MGMLICFDHKLLGAQAVKQAKEMMGKMPPQMLQMLTGGKFSEEQAKQVEHSEKNDPNIGSNRFVECSHISEHLKIMSYNISIYIYIYISMRLQYAIILLYYKL